MEREDDVIDLGTASIETRGNFGPGNDIRNNLQNAGIADD